MAAAPVLPTPASEPAPLSQGARVIDTFIAPSKTFIDLRRSAQWWLPFLLMTIVVWALVYVAEQKIGVQKMVENDLHSRPKAEAQFEKATPEQRQTQVKITGISYYIAIPLFTLIIWLIMAGLQFGTFKFAANADISYGKSLAVVAYAGLPMVLRYLLALASVLAGANPDGFTLNNPVGDEPWIFHDSRRQSVLVFHRVASGHLFAVDAGVDRDRVRHHRQDKDRDLVRHRDRLVGCDYLGVRDTAFIANCVGIVS